MPTAPSRTKNPARDDHGVTARAAQRLRQRLASRYYAAGTRLPFRKLAAELGISQATARTVIMRLAADGDLVWQPGSTACVPPPPAVPINPHRGGAGSSEKEPASAVRSTATMPLPAYPGVRTEERHMT